MRGMENYSEQNREKKNPENEITNINDITAPTQNETEIHNELKDFILNSNKKDINGKNILPLNNITNNLININKNNFNYSIDEMSEEEINSNNKLYEDYFKGEIINYNENFNNNLNGMKKSSSNNNQDYVNILKEDLIDENNLEINDDKVVEDIWKEISNDFGMELSQNISKVINKYVNDDILSYDYIDITENIVKDLKYQKISDTLIEKAIIKIPEIYFLILCNKL